MKALKLVWRQLWITTVVGLVLLALYVSIGRQLLPLLETKQHSIEQWLSTQLALPVGIDRLHGQWRGVFPILLLEGLMVGEQEPIYVAQVSAALDLPRSILRRQPIFTEIQVKGVRARVEQISQHHWQFMGRDFNLEPNSEVQPTKLQPALDWLTLQQDIQLSNISVQLQRYKQAPEQLELDSLSWRSLINQHELKAKLAWGAQQMADVELQLFLEGPLWPLAKQNGQLYLRLDEQDWGHWLAAFNTERFQIEDFRASAQGWLNIEDGQLANSYFKADIKNLILHSSKERYQLQQGSILMAGHRQNNDWFARIAPEFAEPLPFQDIRFNEVEIDNHRAWQVSVGEVDLARTGKLIKRYQLLPEHIAPFIYGTAPQGTAKNVRLAFYQDHAEHWQFDLKADVENGSSSSYHYIPAISQANVSLHVQRQGGLVQIGPEPFSVHLAELYSYPWKLRQSSGYFSWLLEPEQAILRLENLNTELLDHAPVPSYWPVNAELEIRLPLHHRHEPELSLLVGMPQGTVQLAPVLVPNLVGEQAASWLQQALQGGKISTASFALHTELEAHSAENSSTMLLALDLRQGQLAYMPHWPLVTDLNAKVKMNFPELNIQLFGGRTLGGRLTSGQARLYERGGAFNLTLNAELEGDSAEGLAYFTQTPLQQVVNHSFDDWRASGKLAAKLALELPFTEQGEPHIQLQATLTDNQLYIGQAELQMQSVNSSLKFDSHQGLSADTIQAQVLGGPVTLSLSSHYSAQGELEVGLQGTGQARWEALKSWQPLLLLEPVSGQLDYQLALQLHQQHILMQLDSDLLGTDIDYPAPLGKQAAQSRALKLQLQPEPRGLHIDAEYDGMLSAQLQFAGNDVPRGQVVFGAHRAQLPETPGLELLGQFKQPMELEQWWQSFNQLQQASEQYPSAANSPELTEVIRLVDLDLKHPQGWGFELQPLTVKVRGRPQQWQVDLDSSELKGQLLIPSTAKPIVATFEQLRLPKPVERPNTKPTAFIDHIIMEDLNGAEAQVPEEEDPLAELNPAELPATIARIERLAYAGTDYGRWQFRSQSSEQGLKLVLEEVDIHGSQLTGTLLWQGQGAAMQTQLQDLNLTSRNLAKLQQGLKQEVAIDSKDANAQMSLSWQGSPVFFNTQSLGGTVQLRMKRGSLKNEDSVILRAFGALNFGRRLKLDFSDLYQSGVAFDDWQMKAKIDKGVLIFTEPMLVDGPGGKFLTSGNTDLVHEKLDMKIAVTLPVSSNLPLVAILAGLAPPVAASIFVTERLIGDELSRFTSASYTVTGSWQDPEVKLNKAFDDSVEGKKRRTLKERIKGIFSF